MLKLEESIPLLQKTKMIKDIMKWKPILEDIKCSDYPYMRLFCIRPFVAASSDGDNKPSYDLLEEVVSIKGVMVLIQNIIVKKKFASLLELENYLSKYDVHISFIYE